MIGFQIGGLERNERIGCRVALVEAVIGEFRQKVEDLVGLALVEPALDRAGDEALALVVHLLLDLLAHGAAQKVGVAERIARQDLRHLHHLFLVDDDAEGLAQHRLELGVRIPVLLVVLVLAELARAIDRNVRHRARAIERHEGDHVLEPVGLHLHQGLAHARAFHLEHADRLAPAERFVGLAYRRAAAPTDRFRSPLRRIRSTAVRRTVSVLRPRKSNFTRPACSTHFMLYWVTRMPVFGSR